MKVFAFCFAFLCVPSFAIPLSSATSEEADESVFARMKSIMDKSNVIKAIASAFNNAVEESHEQEQDIEARLTTEQSQMLKQHNTFRKVHQAPALTWDGSLSAQTLAYAKKCQWKHSGTPGVGENLYASSTRVNIGTLSIKSWYNEVKNYDFSKPGFSPSTGHFTQVVWKNSARVGCSVNECPASMLGWPASMKAYFVVCQYSPPGNYLGQFAQNVLPAISSVTVEEEDYDTVGIVYSEVEEVNEKVVTENDDDDDTDGTEDPTEGPTDEDPNEDEPDTEEDPTEDEPDTDEDPNEEQDSSV